MSERLEPSESNEAESQLMSSVKRNFHNRNIPLRYPEQITELVEVPLQPACLAFYEKGIRTMESSANPEFQGGEEQSAYITIDYDLLSPENQKIADQLISDGRAELRAHPMDEYQMLVLSREYSNEEPVEVVSGYFLQLVERFVPQDRSWASLEAADLAAAWGYDLTDPEDAAAMPIELAEGSGYKYDEKTGRYWISQDQWQRQQEFLQATG